MAPSRLLVLLSLAAASPAAAQVSELIAKLEPVYCAAPDPALKGRTEFYDAKGRLIHSAKSGAAADAVVAVPDAKLAAFKAVAAHKCPPGTALSAAKLRDFGQVYALGEFMDFDRPENRVTLGRGRGFYSETLTLLYLGKDRVVHVGREKRVGGDGAEVEEGSPNKGSGEGLEGQQAPRVGKLHTHPNSGYGGMIGVPRHHPSDQDLSQLNAYGYYDVVVSPDFVYFINHPKAAPLVFSRKDTFEDNAVKQFLAKESEADAAYERSKKFPPGYDEFVKKNSPWAQ